MAKTSNIPNNLFIAIDGNAIVHRAFHAYPPTLSTRTGLQVNAVYGFTTMLLEVLKRFDPHYIVCTFDTGKPTFRHTEYTEYKAQRKPVDESLNAQFPLVEEVLRAFNIPILKRDGFEADDILGTLAQYVKEGKWANQNIEMIIVTGDRDLLQLINGVINVCLPQGNFKSLTVFNRDSTYEKFGYYPEQVIDYKGIVGDASDNIPGVKGVGEKSVLELLKKYGSFDGIYKNLTELKPKQQQLLGEGIEQAEFSRKLATIKTDVNLDVTLDQCHMRDFKRKDVEDVFVKYEFRSLIGRVPASNEVEVSASYGNGGGSGPQLSMFGGGNDAESGASGPVQPQKEGKYVLFDNETDLKSLETAIEEAKSLSVMYFSKDQTVDGSEMLCVKYGQEKGQTLVVHTNVEKVSTILNRCFTRNAKRETLFANWEEYVSRKNNTPDSSRTNETLEVGLNVFDSFLVGHYLSSGGKKDTLSVLSFDYLGRSLPDLFSLSDVDGFFDVLEKVVEKQKEELFKRESVLKRVESKFDLSKDGKGGLEGFVKFVENTSAVILGQMEDRGVLIDTEKLASLRKDLTEQVAKVVSEIYYHVGHEFNVNSPKQLSDVLFSQLQLPTSSKGKKARSTREEVLEELEGVHPVIEKVLEYRGLNKLLTSYIDSFVNILSSSSTTERSFDEKDNKVLHTDFKQTGASSGRLSSTNPNMQNIPVQGDWAKRIRDMFVAREGYKLVSIDYSQIEFRIMADISTDDALVGDFKKGRDIHRSAAARIFNKDEKEITSAERSKAKTINFGILYGQTPFGLSRQLKIDQKVAAEYIKEYFNEYKGVAAYIDKAALVAQSNGYVETMFGRRRYVSGLDSKNAAVRNAAIREAINMPIQGSAADLMKFSMICVAQMMAEKYAEKAFILLQIHDELIFEVAEDVLEKFEADAKEAMVSCVKLNVPLEVHVSDGYLMSELK